MLVDNDELKAIVEADDSQTTAELAAAFEVSTKTILVHLRQIGKRSASWLDPGSVPKQYRKRKMTPKKVMVTVWWSSAGVIHHSFLPNGTSITADEYCEELNTIMRKLARLQPALVNPSALLLRHDNARPHTAQQTVSKLQELGLEVFRYPPYSPDLAPTDFHFFQNLDNFLAGKNSIAERQYKMPLQSLIPPVQQSFSGKASISYYYVGKNTLLPWYQICCKGPNFY
ncbi:histone-lysine N-methyltransferase SETMAR-like [Melitaea cinxia]|uniref:histone-lysine N-methyltransferase SETMAR-like n=1 Tax=Melitaea cinxia TaxID=113334 RepID=UPI001E273DB0|nr:histone-lysine N-methyltransferase SETMAR-like [Melitaea cinxia]